MGGWRWTSLAACSAGSLTTNRAPEPCRRSPSVGPVSWIVTSPRRARTISRTTAPEAGPASVLAASVVEADEALQHALPVGRWDARPVVGHHQHHPGTLGPDRHSTRLVA